MAFPFYVWTNLPTSKRHNDVRRSNVSIHFIREVKLYETLRIHYVNWAELSYIFYLKHFVSWRCVRFDFFLEFDFLKLDRTHSGFPFKIFIRIKKSQSLSLYLSFSQLTSVMQINLTTLRVRLVCSKLEIKAFSMNFRTYQSSDNLHIGLTDSQGNLSFFFFGSRQ